jgi:hypothetical protein
MSDVAFDTATAEPFLFVAVTSNRSVLPTSPVPRAYAEEVAPLIGLQPFPAVSQRFHW